MAIKESLSLWWSADKIVPSSSLHNHRVNEWFVLPRCYLMDRYPPDEIDGEREENYYGLTRGMLFK